MAQHKRKRQCGTGSIVQEESGLAIRWPEYVVLPDGQRRRKMRYELLEGATAREANDKLLERITKARRDGPKPLEVKAATTFQDHVARWQKDFLESAGAGTEDLYKFSVRSVWLGIIKARLSPRFGKFRLTEISAALIQEWITELRREGLAAATIRQYYKPLRVILARAVLWKEIAENPANPVELPKIRKKEQSQKKWALTPEQAGALLGKIKPLRPRAMIALAITAGLRRGELLAARWKSLDEASSEIAVVEASYRGHIDTPKTEAGERKVPLDQWTMHILKQWRGLSKHTRPIDFIFSTRTGKQETPGNILRRYVFPACDAMKLRRATWNTFRRTFSTWLHHHAIPGKTIATMMGHADEKTQFIYIQPDEDMKRVAAGKIGDELSRYCPDENQMGLPWLN